MELPDADLSKVQIFPEKVTEQNVGHAIEKLFGAADALLENPIAHPIYNPAPPVSKRRRTVTNFIPKDNPVMAISREQVLARVTKLGEEIWETVPGTERMIDDLKAVRALFSQK